MVIWSVQQTLYADQYCIFIWAGSLRYPYLETGAVNASIILDNAWRDSIVL